MHLALPVPNVACLVVMLSGAETSLIIEHDGRLTEFFAATMTGS